MQLLVYKKSSVKVNVEVNCSIHSKHEELLFLCEIRNCFSYVRLYQESWDKPELVIFVSILMLGERKIIMNRNTLKM